jgi:2,4-dienoyl-CoA reductase-like NADH-dependent reductase (Old Yellow Enzyme family)
MGIAYVHVVEPRAGGNDDLPEDAAKSLDPFRKIWQGTFIAAGGYNRANAMEAVATGHADLVAFGRSHLANPDFVKRIALDAPMNPYDRSTFYTQAPEGYTDYPCIEDTEWGKANAAAVAAVQLP